MHKSTNVGGQRRAPLLKKPSKSRDSRFGFFSYAEVISPRKTDCKEAMDGYTGYNKWSVIYPHLDDATSAPNASNACVVQVPIQLFSSLTHEHEALRIRDNLGCVECLLQVINELFLVAAEFLLLWSGDSLTSTGTLCLDGG
jgi:hypothetical protein